MMLRISEKASLALHSIILIARNDKNLINVKQIASITKVSEAHLAKALQELVKARLVRSVRGPKGGFTLLKPPENITLLDVFSAIEGPVENKDCPLNCSVCPFETCILEGVAEKLNNEFFNFMRNKKLSDFVEN
jgi:Rrf2 family protein